MNITTNRLTAAAGLSAAVAGAIFILVQINHPAWTSPPSRRPTGVREPAKPLMCGARAGRHHRHVPPSAAGSASSGLPASSLLSAGYLAHFGTQSVAAFVLPTVATRTRLCQGRHRRRHRSARPTGDIGACSCLRARRRRLLAGGLVFGIALFRAGILSRLGRRPARRRQHLHPGARRAAGVLQPPVGGAHRHRADRPRRLAVARPAPRGVRHARSRGHCRWAPAGSGPMTARQRGWRVRQPSSR